MTNSKKTTVELHVYDYDEVTREWSVSLVVNGKEQTVTPDFARGLDYAFKRGMEYKAKQLRETLMIKERIELT